MTDPPKMTPPLGMAGPPLRPPPDPAWRSALIAVSVLAAIGITTAVMVSLFGTEPVCREGVPTWWSNGQCPPGGKLEVEDGLAVCRCPEK